MGGPSEEFLHNSRWADWPNLRIRLIEKIAALKRTELERPAGARGQIN